jgi:hypothetical protein
MLAQRIDHAAGVGKLWNDEITLFAKLQKFCASVIGALR